MVTAQTGKWLEINFLLGSGKMGQDLFSSPLLMISALGYKPTYKIQAAILQYACNIGHKINVLSTVYIYVGKTVILNTFLTKT